MPGTSNRQRILPAGWNINPSGAFAEGGPYTASVQLTSTGDFTLTVTFKKQYWDGASWIDAGETYTRTQPVIVREGASPTATAEASRTGGGTRTGDDSNIGLWIVLCIAAGASVGGIIAYRRRRENQQ